MQRRLAFQSLEDRRLLAVDSLVVEPFVSGLASPVVATHAADGSGRIFVAEQGGVIRIVSNGAVLADPFLDLSDQLVTGSASGERGLLGLAFHPEYAEVGSGGEGRFFVYYSAPSASGNHDSVIAEYQVLAERPNVANALSRREILRFNQPFANHNGGDLKFGPDDGLLYISSGDGGSGGDPEGNGQDTSTLLGAILRIDIDGDDFADRLINYSIPPTNPFVDDAQARDEIFANGFRNPFRISFDDGNLGAASADRLFVGDVGQGRFEEVDIAQLGGNYGWNVCEGDHVFGQPTVDCPSQFEAPIAEYGRDEGVSVIGGHVYRGGNSQELTGVYVFGDLNGTLMTLEEQADGSFLRSVPEIVGTTPSSIIGFGEDEAGELYVMTFDSILSIATSPPTNVEVDGAGEVSVSFLGDDLAISDPTGTLFLGPITSFSSLTLNLSDGDDRVSVSGLDRLLEGSVSIQGRLGTDAIRIVDGGQVLDLTSLPSARFAQFEQIDISGSLANQLVLNRDAVIASSTSTDTLRVIHDLDDRVGYGEGWTVDLPVVQGNQFLHRLSQDEAIIEVSNSLAFQNPLSLHDVNRDGDVTARDALQIINALVERRGDLNPPVTIGDSYAYVDVSGENTLSALDALRVINELDRTPQESEWIPPVMRSTSDEDDLFIRRVDDDSPKLF